jgi:hypothetical protein
MLKTGRNRSAVSSKWNKCRIYVGDQLDRWNELKEVLRVQTHAEFANILFIGKPNMFFPSFLNRFSYFKNHMLFIVSKQCACSRRVHIEGHMNRFEYCHPGQ